MWSDQFYDLALENVPKINVYNDPCLSNNSVKNSYDYSYFGTSWFCQSLSFIREIVAVLRFQVDFFYPNQNELW